MEILKELPLPLQKHIYEYRVQPLRKVRDAHYMKIHKDKFNHCLPALNNGCLGAESTFRTLYHSDHLTPFTRFYRLNFIGCDYYDDY